MKLKDFTVIHQDKFQNTAKETYNMDKEFIKELISKYPNKVPDVFAELETKEFRKTKFYKWWDNRRMLLKKKNKDGNEFIKITKKEVKEIKVKEVKIKPPKEKKVKEKAIKEKPKKERKKTNSLVIHQTKQINQVYYKVSFKSDLVQNALKQIEINTSRIKLKLLQIDGIIKEYNKKIKDNPEKADSYLKELQCYEKMYKMQSDALNDNQGQLTQLRMGIENDKQIYENKLYDKMEVITNEDGSKTERLVQEVDLSNPDDSNLEMFVKNIKETVNPSYIIDIKQDE